MQALLITRRRQLADNVEGRNQVEALCGERDRVDARYRDAALATVQAHLRRRLVEVERRDAAVFLQGWYLAASATARVQYLGAHRVVDGADVAVDQRVGDTPHGSEPPEAVLHLKHVVVFSWFQFRSGG